MLIGWGYKRPVPKDATAAWGMRAEFRPRDPGVNIVMAPSRASATGSEEDKVALLGWVATTGLPALEERVAYLDPGSNEEVRFTEGGFTIAANPLKSHGYIYLSAWKDGS